MVMAYTLKTQTITAQTISSEEVQKANTAFADLEGAQAGLSAAQQTIAEKNTLLVQKDSVIAQKDARIKELEALIPAPPVPVPPTPVPPVVTKTGLYVDGKDIRSKTGAKLTLRGIELMYGSTGSSNPPGSVATCKSFGANMVGPLYQFNSLTKIKAHLDACRAANIVCAFNVDHIGQTTGIDGRDFLCQPDVKNLLVGYDNIIIQCETELGNEETTGDQWVAQATDLIRLFRNAGHTAPIKVGSPFSGRDPVLAIQRGKDVLANDSLHNVIFTWQAYWGINPNAGWTYQQELGFSRPTVADPIKGHKECTDRIKDSGLCFLVGLDAVDDIGATGYVAHAQYLHSKGIGWQFWALSGDSNGSNLSTGGLDSNPTAIHGVAVKSLLQAQAVTPSL